MPVQSQLSPQEHEILDNTLQYLTNQKNIAGVIQILIKSSPEQRRCLFLKAHVQSGISLQMINKWYSRVSMVQYAGIGDHKIEILRQIEKVLPNYDEKTSLTTFVKSQLQWYQEKHNIHPGRFYDFIYSTCSKFKKSANSLARVRLELRLLEQLDDKNKQIYTQTAALSKALTDIFVETSSGTHERKEIHTYDEVNSPVSMDASFNFLDFSF